MDTSAGTRFGDFLLLRRTHVGVLAESWRAEALRGPLAGRPLLLKRALPTTAEDPLARCRFAEEAALLLRLDHPRLARGLAIGVRHDLPFVVCAWVPGWTLAAVRDRVTGGAPLSGPALAHVGADVADALAALHGLPDGSGRPAGLVHQDVTPDNVLVGLDGRAVLVDLGAAVAAATPPAAFASQATPGYLAPERRTGAAPGARTDLWQLGALLAELASGRRGAAALTALGGGAAADALGAPLLVTLRALVAVDPVERPATAGELAVRLRALAGDPARMGAALAAWTRRTLGEPAA